MAGRILERLIVGLIYLSGVSSILFVFGIFFFVVREGYPVLVEAVGIGDFLTTAWYPTSETNTRYGLLALLAGTFSVTLLAMAVAVPFALGGAVLISEFCTGKVKETLKITVELVLI